MSVVVVPFAFGWFVTTLLEGLLRVTNGVGHSSSAAAAMAEARSTAMSKRC
jgi:hypothetical protein